MSELADRLEQRINTSKKISGNQRSWTTLYHHEKETTVLVVEGPPGAHPVEIQSRGRCRGLRPQMAVDVFGLVKVPPASKNAHSHLPDRTAAPAIRKSVLQPKHIPFDASGRYSAGSVALRGCPQTLLQPPLGAQDPRKSRLNQRLCSVSKKIQDPPIATLSHEEGISVEPGAGRPVQFVPFTGSQEVELFEPLLDRVAKHMVTQDDARRQMVVRLQIAHLEVIHG